MGDGARGYSNITGLFLLFDTYDGGFEDLGEEEPG